MSGPDYLAKRDRRMELERQGASGSAISHARWEEDMARHEAGRVIAKVAGRHEARADEA